MKKIVLATRNEGKIREMKHALQGSAYEIVSLAEFPDIPEVEENGTTFTENSRCKALFYMQHTGCDCLADDSGLEVTALGGAPGVHSARYAGEHGDDAANNAKLQQELEHRGLSESPACYKCVMTFAAVNHEILVSEGCCRGTVRIQGKGQNGFGYDPYFYIDAEHTMAEISMSEKEKISHRGEALRKMAALLRERAV